MTEVTQREIDQRFVDLEKSINERFSARDREVILQAADRKDKLALWLAIGSLLVALATLIAVLPK